MSTLPRMNLTELQTLRMKLGMEERDLIRLHNEESPNAESIATTERVIQGYRDKTALFPPE